MFDSLQVEALGDDYHPPLGIEAQSNLGTALVVLFSNGHEHLILQQGRAFQIHPDNRQQISIIQGPCATASFINFVTFCSISEDFCYIKYNFELK